MGDAEVAYKVLGSGPLDLLYFVGLGNHVDMLFDDPRAARLIGGLASFSRLIVFDRRGTGASDRLPRNAMPSWEDWTQDVAAVLDAVESDPVVIFAGIDAGPIAMLFTAMHPSRVDALVLANTTARFLVADDYPIGASLRAVDAVVSTVRTLWGTTEFTRVVNPTLADDTEFVQEDARRLRSCATPREAAAQYRYILQTLDVRSVLASIQSPTLVLHTRDNPFIPVEHGRYLADHIEGARFVELPAQGIGFDDGMWTRVLDEVAEFLTGERPEVDVDRVLTTVLFTDIVASTEQAATVGDQQWRRLLDAHDRAVRAELRRFSGHEINTTGDGFCASFAGPARAMHAARAIIEAARRAGTEVRAGLHTGECEVRNGGLYGLAVHIAARVTALAGPGEVLVSSTVKELAGGSSIEFADMGEHELRGVPGRWRLFAVKA